MNSLNLGREGFEPTKPKQQIYSLPPLTTRESPHNLLYMSRLSESNRGPHDYKSGALAS